MQSNKPVSCSKHVFPSQGCPNMAAVSRSGLHKIYVINKHITDSDIGINCSLVNLLPSIFNTVTLCECRRFINCLRK